MPRKLRILIAELITAGFIDRGGKGSHRNFIHPKGMIVTIYGKGGSDAKPYQEQLVAKQIKVSRS